MAVQSLSFPVCSINHLLWYYLSLDIARNQRQASFPIFINELVLAYEILFAAEFEFRFLSNYFSKCKGTVLQFYFCFPMHVLLENEYILSRTMISIQL